MRYISIFILVVLLLVGCSTKPIPTSRPEQLLEVRDVTRVSTSAEGNHVNTVSILREGEWVVMSGTGGTLTSADFYQDMGKGNRCFLTIFIGPTTLEYSIEVKGDDYFLAYSDYTENAVGTNPEDIGLWFASVNIQNDFCNEGIERYRIRPSTDVSS